MHFLSKKSFLTPSQFIIYLTENVLELWTSLAFLYLSYAFYRNQMMLKDTTYYDAPQILTSEEKENEAAVMQT